jgi:hypothetical protein
MIFDYPQPQGERRHGPANYAAYESYRPWLRDEFAFRCVYCLKRETWGQVTADFDLDHFAPQSLNPLLRLDYLNLIYSCWRCNAVKRDTQLLIRQLDLNSPRLKSWRVMWMRIVALAKDRDTDLYFQLVGFPKDLPDLSKQRPPLNTRQESLEQCWFARRQRGELPPEY